VITITGIASLFIVFLSAYSALFALLAPASVSLDRISTFLWSAGIVGGLLYVVALLLFLVWPSRTSIYIQYFLIAYGAVAICLSGYQIVISAILNWRHGYLFNSDIAGVLALVMSMAFVGLLSFNRISK
jgi:hypothetical protein